MRQFLVQGVTLIRKSHISTWTKIRPIFGRTSNQDIRNLACYFESPLILNWSNQTNHLAMRETDLKNRQSGRKCVGARYSDRKTRKSEEKEKLIGTPSTTTNNSVLKRWSQEVMALSVYKPSNCRRTLPQIRQHQKLIENWPCNHLRIRIHIVKFSMKKSFCLASTKHLRFEAVAPWFSLSLFVSILGAEMGLLYVRWKKREMKWFLTTSALSG